MRKEVFYGKSDKRWGVEVTDDRIVVTLGGFEIPEEASKTGDSLVDMILLLRSGDGRVRGLSRDT